MLYWCIKQGIKFALFCYYKRVEMHGLAALPVNRPLMLLPNHQNALLDALLIAAYSKNAPYFLTRSDVFNSRLLKASFRLLRMLPIYRLRDGRDSLGRNQGVFDQCSRLLNNNETVLLFPEANHNLMRMVRPLSKGFTRILFNTLELYPGMDILVVPVGVNYINASGFPDSAAFYFGRPLHLNTLYKSKDSRIASMEVREKVAAAIKQLTTHIGAEYRYEEVLDKLKRFNANYLDPESCNALIEESAAEQGTADKKQNNYGLKRIWDLAFGLINLPLLLPWRLFIKNRVAEEEFVSTYRFLYACILFPLYFTCLLLLFTLTISFKTALAILIILFLFNLFYVKLR